MPEQSESVSRFAPAREATGRARSGILARAMSERGRILVVDDDADVRSTVRDYLELAGFDVFVAADGPAMREVMASRRIELVLMDINLPGEDGLALTRELRASHSVSVIMLTAMGQTLDRIIGLEMGADDYVAKPFDPRELLARIKSVLRRARERAPAQAAAEKPEVVKMGTCTLDLAGRRLYGSDGTAVVLTSMEFDLLKAFAAHPDRVLSREQLLDLAHNREGDVFDRSIDVRVTRIRRKIEVDPEKPQVLKTVRNAGYMFISGRKR
jgi:two-component system, OmpR family, phosphate regulon response regulator OmpR